MMIDRIPADKILQSVAESVDGCYGVLLRQGTLEIGYYKPLKVDPQTPHQKDEICVVHSGRGSFVINGKCRPFEIGDVFFVPAGTEHCFVDFSDDFGAWAILYGPQGGVTECPSNGLPP